MHCFALIISKKPHFESIRCVYVQKLTVSDRRGPLSKLHDSTLHSTTKRWHLFTLAFSFQCARTWQTLSGASFAALWFYYACNNFIKSEMALWHIYIFGCANECRFYNPPLDEVVGVKYNFSSVKVKWVIIVPNMTENRIFVVPYSYVSAVFVLSFF